MNAKFVDLSLQMGGWVPNEFELNVTKPWIGERFEEVGVAFSLNVLTCTKHGEWLAWITSV